MIILVTVYCRLELTQAGS
ncbi:hypothetical protein HaLaN_22411, partial [Haematococcus lacustris]